MPPTYERQGPDFKFCGQFTGRDGSALRWLKRLDYELERWKKTDGTIPPEKYIQAFDLLISENALAYVEAHRVASSILYTKEATTAERVDTFRGILRERSFNNELADLRQRDGEALASYYQRVASMMQRVGGKDRLPCLLLSQRCLTLLSEPLYED